MTHQNPLSLAALSREEVSTGIRFVWWTPGERGSVKRGVFLSEPALDDHEDLLVQYRLDGEQESRVSDLCSMGITPDSRGEWGNSLTILETES